MSKTTKGGKGKSGSSRGTAPPKLWLRIEMLADWHIGSGEAARGDIDRFTARDEAGYPCIPVSSLRGILRDSAEQVAFALDGGAAAGDWSRFVEQLFGDEPTLPGGTTTGPMLAPRPGCLTVGRAEYTSLVKLALKTPELKAALTFVKPGVSIDATSGTAAEEKYLRIEVARRDSVLFAPFDFLFAGKARFAATRLLQLVCILTERVGGKRRRGLGRCKLTLMQEGTAGRLVALFIPDAKGFNSDLPGKPPVIPPGAHDLHAVTQSATAPGPAPAFDEFCIRLDIRSPVVVGAQTESNIVTGADFIPGGALLPVLAGAFRRAYPGKAGAINAAISAGRFRVLPGYPVMDERRCLPVPLGWQVPKDMPEGLAVKLTDGLGQQSAGEGQHRTLRQGYVMPKVENGLAAYLRHARLVLVPHNVIDNDKQRPTAEVGGYFSYEGISPGQSYEFVLLADRALDLKKDDIPTGARIGRARARGYGEVVLSLSAGGGGDDRAIAAGSGQAGKTLGIYLASDAALTDRFGQPAADIEALVDALGLAGKVDIVASPRRLAAAIRDGWTSAWNLPRAGLLVLRAGSRAMLKLTADVADADLVRMVAEGIGERRAEGFGDIRINPPWMETIKELAFTMPVAQAAAPGHPVDGGPSTFVDKVRDCAWQSLIAEIADELAGSEAARALAPETASQSELRKLRGKIAGPGRNGPSDDAFLAFRKMIGDRAEAAVPQIGCPVPAGLPAQAAQLALLTRLRLLQGRVGTEQAVTAQVLAKISEEEA